MRLSSPTRRTEGAAPCERCRATFGVDEPRVQTTNAWSRAMDLQTRCFADIDDDAQQTHVGDELALIAKQRRALRAMARRGRSFERDASLTVVDRRGRPQRRALLMGPEIKESSPSMLELEHCSLVLCWSSATSEYRFVPHFWANAADFDPVTELCAAVVVGARRKLTASHRER